MSGFQREAFEDVAPLVTERLFRFDDAAETVDVFWGGYEYPIELSRIPTPLALLEWVAHLGQKEWPEASGQRMAAFIEAVCRRKGWDLWAGH